jgi:hypothetical protein
MNFSERKLFACLVFGGVYHEKRTFECSWSGRLWIEFAVVILLIILLTCFIAARTVV